MGAAEAEAEPFVLLVVVPTLRSGRADNFLQADDIHQEAAGSFALMVGTVATAVGIAPDTDAGIPDCTVVGIVADIVGCTVAAVVVGIAADTVARILPPAGLPADDTRSPVAGPDARLD